MTQYIAGVGMTCPPPQSLYPSELGNAPPDFNTAYLTLNAGDAIPVPAQSNDYLVDLGLYSTLEYLDATTGAWRPLFDMAYRPGMFHWKSNGITSRIANRLGCPVSAIVANGGTGFVQASTTITASVGGSTWNAIVGGSLSVSTINNAGAKYTVPPMLAIPAPPAFVTNSIGGVPATAYCSIANGTVSSVSLYNFGAGYTSTQTVVAIPSPYDVNLGSITAATVTFIVDAGAATKITAAVCTNFGAPLATLTALTLTAAGAGGSGATITPQILQTISSGSVVAGGAGWGTATAFADVRSVGGGSVSVAATALSNPDFDLSKFVVRGAAASGTTNAGGTITAVTFPSGAGMFLSAPTAAVASGGTLPTTLASITFVMGTTTDTVVLQPL